MKIAMMGTRGIPANYGGFETCVEAISTRLAARGHQVTVYNRPHHVKWAAADLPGRAPRPAADHRQQVPRYAGPYRPGRARTPAPRGADIVLIFVAANSPLTLIPRLAGRKTVLHVDGLDWKRDKWPALAKRYIRGGRVAGHAPAPRA